ncbi:MAG: nucleotide sugar epimerase [Methyloceanibacter sp.]|nr:MAG: nucleotide sugar epimerase [Methyloceanibacter sp.]
MNDFKNAKVLVVGGAGFVGSNLVCRLLKDEPDEIHVVDNLLSAEADNVPADGRVRFKLGSIADDRLLASLPHDLDYVFHLACYHGNQSSIADPIADHDNNTITTLKLFDRLKADESIRAVVYAAAGCAVAEKTFDDARATNEDAPVSLYHDSPYSISKLIGEFYGNYYFLRHGLPVIKTRFQNIYGPREILGAGRWRGTPHTVWRNVTPTFVWRALNHEVLPLENGGIATRDFVFVEDLVEGLCLAATRGKPGEVYNLASGVETQIRELAELVNEITDNPTQPDVKPARDWDRSGMRFGSTEKSKRELGFEAKTPVRDGLTKTVEWTRNNRALISRSIARHDRFMREF